MSKEEIKKEKPNEISRIINEILNLNKEVQEQRGSGLKVLTPDQMLSRLRITLPQLNAGNNYEKRKMKLGNYCILCTDQNNLQDNSIKV